MSAAHPGNSTSANAARSLFECRIPNSAWSLFAFTFVCSVIAYGYWLFNFQLFIDGEFQNNFYQTIAFGRWVDAFLHHWVLPEPYIPYLTPLLSLAFLSMAAVATASVLTLRGAPAYAFCAMFVSFPQLTYQFQFVNQSATLALGLLCAAASVHAFILAEQAKGAGRAALYIASTGLVILPLGIYQTLVVVPPLILLGRFLFQDEQSWRATLRQLFRFALVCIIALAVYVAISRGLRALYYWHFAEHHRHNTHLSQFIVPGILSWERFQQVSQSMAHGIWDGAAFGLKTFKVTLAAVLLAVYSLLRKPSGVTARGALVVLLVLLAPFMLLIINPWLPPRILVAMNVSAAILLAYIAQRLNPRLALAAVAVLLIMHAAYITQLFYSDTQVRSADILKANRIQTIVNWKYPDFDPAATPVYFHGGTRNDNPHKLPASDVFGSSFFAWDGGNNNRLIAFFNYYGIARYQLADREAIIGLLPKVEALAIWPNAGAIEIIDGVLVIKLGEKRGWLPFPVE